MWKKQLVKICSSSITKKTDVFIVSKVKHTHWGSLHHIFKWMKTSPVEVMKCRRSANRLRPSSFSHKEWRSACSPPCLGRALLGSQTLSISEPTANQASVESPTENPTDWLLSSLWYRAMIWKRLFSQFFFFSWSFHLCYFHTPPHFLTHLHFFQFLIIIPLLTHPFLISRAILKRMLIHQMQLSKGTFGKNNNLFCPFTAKSHHESCFDSIDRNT